MASLESSSTQKRGVAVFQLARCLLACWCSRVSPSCAHVVVTVVMIVVAAAAAKDASAAGGGGALAILQVEKPSGDDGDWGGSRPGAPRSRAPVLLPRPRGPVAASSALSVSGGRSTGSAAVAAGAGRGGVTTRPGMRRRVGLLGSGPQRRRYGGATAASVREASAGPCPHDSRWRSGPWSMGRTRRAQHRAGHSSRC